MCKYSLNQDCNGIEISFENKPAADILSALKANGFRWHNIKKLWYAKQTADRLQLAETLSNGAKIETAARENKPATPKKNKYGVKVGDIFSASWGYEQTNNDFFQVIALAGDCSVRVREVVPKLANRNVISDMAQDDTYNIDSSVMLPPSSYSVFIKDQEHGDLKRLKSYAADGISNPLFCISSYADAYYCADGLHTVYESFYA